MRGADGFGDLRNDWNALFDRIAKPHQLFSSYIFLSTWIESYGDQYSELLVVAAYVGDELVAAMPLAAQRSVWLDRLQLMGSPVAQFGDILIDPDHAADAAPAVWAAITALNADLLEARRIRQDSALWPLWHEHGRVVERQQSPFACLAKRVEAGEPGSAYSAKERSGFRRRRRRLGERGEVTFRTYESGAVASELAARAVAMKVASLRQAGVVSTAVRSHGFADFFRRLAAKPDNGLLISTIELSGRPIGIDLSFLCKGTAFGHVLATDMEFERDGVGSLLIHGVFANAQAAGTGTFDLLAPADPYKMRHADGLTNVESRVYAFTAKGWALGTFWYGLVLPQARKAAKLLSSLMGHRKRRAVKADDADG